MEKKSTVTVIWLVVLVGVAVMAFKLGADSQGERHHRRQCLLEGGFPEGMFKQECYIKGKYNPETRNRLDNVCSNGKGWYIYNDVKSYWRHKCG